MEYRNGTLIFTMASLVAVFTIFQLWPIWNLFKHGTVTEGTITGINPSEFGDGYFFFNDLSIDFRTENGKSFSITEDWVLKSGDVLGGNVNIVYDAANPTTAVSFKLISTHVLILLADLLVIAYSIFVIIKRRKRNRSVSTDSIDRAAVTHIDGPGTTPGQT